MFCLFCGCLRSVDPLVTWCSSHKPSAKIIHQTLQELLLINGHTCLLFDFRGVVPNSNESRAAWASVIFKHSICAWANVWLVYLLPGYSFSQLQRFLQKLEFLQIVMHQAQVFNELRRTQFWMCRPTAVLLLNSFSRWAEVGFEARASKLFQTAITVLKELATHQVL